MKRTATMAALAISAALTGCGGSRPPGTAGTPPAAPQVAVGAITARSAGSITVNGRTISTAAAQVTIEKQRRSESELKPGMVVVVRGSFDLRSGEASEVESEHAVEGKVEGKADDRLSVGGQEVKVDDDTRFDDDDARMAGVAVGDLVRVAGVADDRGRIRASRVEHAAAVHEVELVGFVADLAPAGFTLRLAPSDAGGYAVTLAAGVSLPAGTANGSRVEVRSDSPISGTSITAISVSLEDARLGEAGAEVEIEGIVTGGDSSLFTVAGQKVQTSAATRWNLGVPVDLVPGVEVEAEGPLDASGTLQAEVVSFRAAFRLRAEVSDLSMSGVMTGTFRLLGIAVSVSDLTDWRLVPASLANGMQVEVRGTPGASGLAATRLEAAADVRPILQGVAAAAEAGAGTLSVLGLTVQTDGGTEFHLLDGAAASRDAFFAAIEAGRTVVKARGRDASALSGTTFTAREMEIEGDQ